MKKIAILQSNYIPWKGYFDLINSVDEFILYDDMQYTRRDWRNRNVIKSQNGLKWLTIPVESKGRYYQKISETVVSDKNWAVNHWNILREHYRSAPFFGEYRTFFEEFYLSTSERYLSRINFELIRIVNRILGIETSIRWSSEFDLEEGRTERLLGICQQSKADTYLSGAAAKEYFDEPMAKEMGIKIEWIDYSGYPEYPQLYPPFAHNVSVLDVIFNLGPDANLYMKSFVKCQ